MNQFHLKEEIQYNYIFGYLLFTTHLKRTTSEMRLGFIIYQPDVQNLIITILSATYYVHPPILLILIMGLFCEENAQIENG